MKRTKQSLILEEEQKQQRRSLEQKLIIAIHYFDNKKFKEDISINDNFENVIKALSGIDFFKNNCQENNNLREFVSEAINHAKYEKFNRGQIVFNYGQFGDKMYIILYGEAGVYVPKNRQQIDQEKSLQNEHYPIEDEILLYHKNNPKYWDEKVPLFKKVVTFSTGQCFGDVALISNHPRSASIITQTDKLICLTINRNDYQQISKKTIQEHNKVLDYFEKILPNVKRFSISRFIQNLKLITIEPDQQIWQKGDEPQFFMFIVSGKVEVYTTVNEDFIQEQVILSHNEFKIKLKRIIVQINLQQITQQGEDQCVGQEEIVKNIPQRLFSCRSLSAIIAYKVDSNLYKRIRLSYMDIEQQLIKISLKHQNFLNEREQQINKNLVRYQNEINTSSPRTCKQIQHYHQKDELLYNQHSYQILKKEIQEKTQQFEVKQYQRIINKINSTSNLDNPQYIRQNMTATLQKSQRTKQSSYIQYPLKSVGDIVDSIKTKLSQSSQRFALNHKEDQCIARSRCLTKRSELVRTANSSPSNQLLYNVSSQTPKITQDKFYTNRTLTNRFLIQKPLMKIKRKNSKVDLTKNDEMCITKINLCL